MKIEYRILYLEVVVPLKEDPVFVKLFRLEGIDLIFHLLAPINSVSDIVDREVCSST